MDLFPALIGPLVLGALLIMFLGRAAMALEKLARAHEKSATAQQDTVYLLREIATLLKSNKENKQP